MTSPWVVSIRTCTAQTQTAAQEKKIQSPTTSEYTSKYPQQKYWKIESNNLGKKLHTMTSWDLFQRAKVNLIFKKINKCKASCKEAKEEKSYGHIN